MASLGGARFASLVCPRRVCETQPSAHMQGLTATSTSVFSWSGTVMVDFRRCLSHKVAFAPEDPRHNSVPPTSSLSRLCFESRYTAGLKTSKTAFDAVLPPSIHEQSSRQVLSTRLQAESWTRSRFTRLTLPKQNQATPRLQAAWQGSASICCGSADKLPLTARSDWGGTSANKQTLPQDARSPANKR